MSRLSIASRAVLAAAVTTGALLGSAGTAFAHPGAGLPRSGDDRATAHEDRNATGKDCATLFADSEVLGESDLTFEVDESGTYLDITGIAGGVEVSGVVVKGGPAYNTYAPGDLGDLPWSGLHAPLRPSGKPAEISHWFACGAAEDRTTDTRTTETSPSETSPSETSQTEPTEPTGTGPAGEQPSPGPVLTTTSPAVAPAAAEDELAETGVDAGPLVGLGAVLLLGGGSLLFLMRTRRTRR